MKGETLKGHLDMIVLAALEAGPAHGYAIIEEIRRRSGGAFDLPEGTVYPVLHRLEELQVAGQPPWGKLAGRAPQGGSMLTRLRRQVARRCGAAPWAEFSWERSAPCSVNRPAALS